MSENETFAKSDFNEIGEFWDRMNIHRNDELRTNWWNSATIVRHINKIVCGEACSGYNAGHIRMCREMFAANIPFKKGLSIGCGPAHKELGLVKSGLVESFDLYELSKYALKVAHENFQKAGLEDKVSFYLGDIFSGLHDQKYDFIYWGGSLHHMFDAEQAIVSTYNMLTDGGCFFMEDFVGMNRFQWTDIQMKYVNEFRCSIPNIYFINERLNVKYYKVISHPNIDELIKSDPSEAKDSEAIIPALKKHLNLKLFKPTGGIIYHIALGGLVEQIPEDSQILKTALNIDAALSEQGLYNYACALAVK